MTGVKKPCTTCLYCVHIDILLAFRKVPARFPQEKPQAIQMNTWSQNI